MSNCYICNVKLNDSNKSIEHIIPNAIGGRLTSKDLLCKDCNSKYGQDSEAKLMSQFNFYANFLMIKRQRGNPQPVIMENQKDGKKYSVNHEGMPTIDKPTINKVEEDGKLHFTITARNMKEGREILNRLSKKYKKLNVDEILKTAKEFDEYIQEPLHYKIVTGGIDVLPAVLKMALDYYIFKTGDIFPVRNAIEDLKSNKTAKVEPIVLEKRLYELDENEVSHCIYLRGSQEEKKLYAIIELFNINQFIVKLSDNYNLPDFEDLYVFDVLLCSERRKEIKYKLDYAFIFNFTYPTSNPNFYVARDAANRVFEIGYKRQQDKYLEGMVRKIYTETIGHLKPGDPFPDEDKLILSKRVAEEVVNYFIRMRML